MSKFVVIVESHEARSGAPGQMILTKEGDRFVALADHEGWVEATSERYDGSTIPASAKTFPTREAAENFAKRWGGHPWWCRPNGNHEVIEVAPVYKQVFAGYQIQTN